LAKVSFDEEVSVRGDPDHPANFGQLCSKGAALAETLGQEGRLLYPEIDGREASWGEALDLVAAKFAETIAAHGPEAVAFYVSGQLLTEDYYVANKLMKGFIGGANIDTNSRLCMASAVAGHRRAFGADVVPGTYRDLELADLIVLVGANLAWCHPVLYQRIAAAKEAQPDMRVVLIDPRRTITADITDLHLPIRSEGDTALFCGLLAFLAAQNRIDRRYIAAHTTGFDEALAAAKDVSTYSTGCSPRRRRWSPSSARASTSPSPVPTRSTPSSTAISPRGGWAGPAWGHSRSQGSPTPWAAARSVASPTCLPPIWSSTIRFIANGCSVSGARRGSRKSQG
jgi:anaerobic selenocysteine-containing dehydrogenase